MGKCVACGKGISGVEIFGDPPNELCWDCYSALLWDGNTEVTCNFQFTYNPEWLYCRMVEL